MNVIIDFGGPIGLHSSWRMIELGWGSWSWDNWNNEEGEIARGPRSRSMVVLHPPDTLSDGARLTPRAN